jgi:hypothetical protein
MMPNKIDLKVTLKEFYQPGSKEVGLITVPGMQFLMIDGIGSPGDSEAYQDALAILYPVAFKTKFISKSKGKDYVVPPLEGLWWADEMKHFTEGNREKWKWTMMIMQPDWITRDMINEAIKMTKEKNPHLSKSVTELRLERFEEGKAAQIMHVGPYSEEAPTIKKIHDFIKMHGGLFDGHKQKHHEIYLSDPRKANPAKMKTVIRQPFI